MSQQPDLTEPGNCGCDALDTDDDGVYDCDDVCLFDPDKTNNVGECGCDFTENINHGTGAVECVENPNAVCNDNGDDDGDGEPNCSDECPQNPDLTLEGDCGCDSTDLDGDNVYDCQAGDQCPGDPDKVEPGQCGCNFIEGDVDPNTGQPTCEENPFDIPADCAGVVGGDSVLDDGGECCLPGQLDCDGMCFGGAMQDNTGACCGFDQMDCNGICNGNNTIDGCGTCDADPTNDCCGGPNDIVCPNGDVCADNPNDDCDPMNGGVDCPGICEQAQGCGAGEVQDQNGVCCTAEEIDRNQLCNGGNVEDPDGAVARPPRLPVMAFASANHSSMPVVSVVVEIPKKILTLTPVSIWVVSVCAVLSVETSLRNLVAMSPSISVVLA